MSALRQSARRCWEDVREGEMLPAVIMPVTLRLCVLDAASTRDFFPGHHDREYARGQNARDIYLNTMFFHGLVDRVGGDWAGPEAWLARRRLDMVAPVCVGDTIRSEGRVVRRYEDAGRGLVDVEVCVLTEHGLDQPYSPTSSATAVGTIRQPVMGAPMLAEPNEERALIQAFVERLTAKYDRRYWVERAQQGGDVTEMWHEIGRAGYLGVTVPEEYGGSGLSMVRLTILMEELANHGVPLLFLVVSTAMACILIAKHGTEEQKRRYLPPLAEGRERFCFAVTEPDAGSNDFQADTDAGAPRWRSLILRGQKTFITGVDDAQHMLGSGAHHPANQVTDKREGMSLFIVDTKTVGLEAQRIDTRIVAPERQFQVFFDDVRIAVREPPRRGRGTRFTALFDALNPERIILGAMAVGLGRFALGKARRVRQDAQGLQRAHWRPSRPGAPRWRWRKRTWSCRP